MIWLGGSSRIEMRRHQSLPTQELFSKSPPFALFGSQVVRVCRRDTARLLVFRLRFGKSAVRLVGLPATRVQRFGDGVMLTTLARVVVGDRLKARGRRWATVVRRRARRAQYKYGFEVMPIGVPVCIEGVLWVW